MRFPKVGLAAIAASLSLVSSANAGTVILDVGAMDHARTVAISGLQGNVSAAPMQFQAVKDGRSFSILAWCADVYHHISVKDYVPDLIYSDEGFLTTDFNGAPLDAGDEKKIGLLANYGDDVFRDVPVSPSAFTDPKPARASYANTKAGLALYNAALATYNGAKAAHTAKVTAYNTAVITRYTRLSAVQAAIWQVASNRNVTSVTPDAAFDLLVDNLSGPSLTSFFAGGYGPQGHNYTLLTPVQQFGGKNGKTKLPLTQSFVSAAIPEPATWTMMILGFGGAGAMLRRSRRTVACATA